MEKTHPLSEYQGRFGSYFDLEGEIEGILGIKAPLLSRKVRIKDKELEGIVNPGFTRIFNPLNELPISTDNGDTEFSVPYENLALLVEEAKKQKPVGYLGFFQKIKRLQEEGYIPSELDLKKYFLKAIGDASWKMIIPPHAHERIETKEKGLLFICYECGQVLPVPAKVKPNISEGIAYCDSRACYTSFLNRKLGRDNISLRK